MIKILLLTFLFGLSACEAPPQVNAFVKGSFNEIQQRYQGQPYIIVFWSQDCAYCMKELGLLGELLKKEQGLRIVTVATDPFLDKQIVHQIMNEHELSDVETWVFADAISQKLYFDVDHRWRGELPLMFLFDSQNNKTKHSGMISEQAMLTWLDKLN